MKRDTNPELLFPRRSIALTPVTVTSELLAPMLRQVYLGPSVTDSLETRIAALECRKRIKLG
ncbi:MAG: hypothetical protein L0177_17770 [Chloroflexi bacterium]|nr:hypothetical protein [Chloroflexota bacterium]